MSDRDAEIEEELRDHVARLTEENVAAGMTLTEARRAASLRFGSTETIRELSRSQRRFAWMGNLVRDLGFAGRTLRKSPGFAALVVLTLGLGIGACTAIFSVVDGVLLRPLPYPEPERLVVLREVNLPRFDGALVRPDTYREWRQRASSFEHLALVRDGGYTLTGRGEPVRVYAARVTANTFSTFGVRPALGRDFAPEEDTPGKGNVAIVSHRFWRRVLGGGAGALATAITLDGQPFTVVGVMAAGFELEGGGFDLYVPDGQPPRDDQSDTRSLTVFGRLGRGSTVARARAEMTRIAAGLEAEDARYRGWGVRLTPLLDHTVAGVRPALLALLAAAGFLLIVACANVANLLLARSATRTREMAVRAALGAGRGRLLGQMLAEGLLLSFMGGAAGVVFAMGGLRSLLSLAPDTLPRVAALSVDARALGLALVLCLAVGVSFGLTPLLPSLRDDLRAALGDGGGGAADSGETGCGGLWSCWRWRSPWCCWPAQDSSCAASHGCMPSIGATSPKARWPSA